ncbi:MAG: hypothetical protein ACI89W_000268 [Gammaproteobacteria bacterium]|jgi:hypothetical protein
MDDICNSWVFNQVDCLIKYLFLLEVKCNLQDVFMKFKLIIVLLCLGMTHAASAALISSSQPIIAFVDRNVLSYSENQYTYENGNGNIINGKSILVSGMDVEWLSLNFTTNHSYNEILTLTQAGQKFEGWRLASSADMVDLITIFMGGPIDFNMLFSNPNDTFQIPEWEGAMDAFHPYFRDTFGIYVTQENPDLVNRLGIGEGYWNVGGHFNDDLNLTGFSNSQDAPTFFVSQVSTARGNGAIDRTGMGDYISIGTFGGREQKYPTFGSFLVKDSVHVDEPITLFLFIMFLVFAVSRQHFNR